MRRAQSAWSTIGTETVLRLLSPSARWDGFPTDLRREDTHDDLIAHAPLPPSLPPSIPPPSLD